MPAREGPFKDLLSCYYGSLGPLYLTRFDESGNVQDLARYTPPHTDQQSVEPMGARAQVINGEMVFFASIDAESYPRRYIDLRRMIVKELDPQAFIHPVDGQIYGYFSKFDPSHSADERNGCRVQFTFERVATSATIVTREILRDAFETATVAAGAADVGTAALGIPFPRFSSTGNGTQITTYTAQVEDWRTFLNTGGSDLRASEITSRINEFRAGINDAISSQQLLDPRNYEVYRALRSLSVSIVSAAEQALSNAITLIEFRLEAESSAQELALQYYSDVERAEEIAALNPCRFFFYPRHTVIRIPDR